MDTITERCSAHTRGSSGTGGGGSRKGPSSAEASEDKAPSRRHLSERSHQIVHAPDPSPCPVGRGKQGRGKQGKQDGCEYIEVSEDGSDSWKLDTALDLLQRCVPLDSGLHCRFLSSTTA
jgi:hypothetical protein